jgi:hypothetical protein
MFRIETGDNTEPIQNGQGRYKLIGDSSWINFNIDIDNSSTPDIIINGSYELEVRVSYKIIPTEADWSPWRGSTFRVSENDCNSAYYYAKRDQTIGVL